MNSSESETSKVYSPPALGKLYAIAPEKIINWIRRGELIAVDVSDVPGQTRPRYRILEDDWNAFLKRREVKPRSRAVQTTRVKSSRRKRGSAIEYF